MDTVNSAIIRNKQGFKCYLPNIVYLSNIILEDRYLFFNFMTNSIATNVSMRNLSGIVSYLRSVLSLQSKKKRILIVKPGALGDLFLALPAAVAMKEAFPNSEIDWLVAENLVSALSLFPQVDRAIPIRFDTLFAGSKSDKIKAILSIRAKIKRGYDAILLLQRHPAYLAFLVGKGSVYQLLREVPGGIHRCFLHGYKVVSPLSLHESLAVRELTSLALADMGAISPANWYLPYSPDTSKIPYESKAVCFHLGGGENIITEFRLKRWPKMLELLRILLIKRKERFVLVGSSAERQESEMICQELKAGTRIVNMVGQTSLPELVREIAKAKLFVGPDSGPLHIADQLGIASIGIYGPTSAVSWGVLGAHSQVIVNSVDCHPCYKDDGVFPQCINHHKCMIGLSVDRVITAIIKSLESFDILS